MVRLVSQVSTHVLVLDRVSHYEVSVDEAVAVPQKSSGLLVCTGTGSSSWYRSLHQVDVHLVARLLSLASASRSDKATAAKVAEHFNRDLIFPSDSPLMAYSVRELITNRAFSLSFHPHLTHFKLLILLCLIFLLVILLLHSIYS